MPGARMNSPFSSKLRNAHAFSFPAMSRSFRNNALSRGERPTVQDTPAAPEYQTETGFSSLEPAAWQKVWVSVVVWPFLVAVSSIGRQVLPSARLVLAPIGLA